MDGDWRQQLQEAQQQIDAEFLKRFDHPRTAPSSAYGDEDQHNGSESAFGGEGAEAGGYLQPQLQGPLSGLTLQAFERPRLSTSESVTTDAGRLMDVLEREEEELMQVVERTLQIRDKLVAANSEADVDFDEIRVLISSTTTAAGHAQLRCAHIDVSGEAAHKNMASREWKTSLAMRYTKLQKILLRLTKVASYLESSSKEDRPTPFAEYAAKLKHNWSHHRTLQQKLQALQSGANVSVCSSYVTELQEQSLPVIQEVYGFLAAPAAHNYTLMLYSRTLTPAEVLIPLRLCATSSMMYGNLISLYLCDCRLSDEHMSKLETVLPELRNLQLVALRDNSITCTGAAELAQALKRCKSLRKLWLDGNRIQARGAEALHLQRNLQGTVIEQISLSRNPVGDAGLFYMMLALMNPLRKSYLALQAMYHEAQHTLTRRKSESTLATSTSHALFKTTNRKMRQIFIRLIAVRCFLAIRCRGRTTPVLLLEDMQLTSRGMDMIAHVLRENTSITALHLSNNTLRDEGAAALAAALQHAINLKTLDIAYNDIGERGIEVLMRAADQSQSLQSLELSGNEITGTGLNWITSVGRSFYLDEVMLEGRQPKQRKQTLQPHEIAEELMRYEQYYGQHGPFADLSTYNPTSFYQDRYDLL